jgi:imidazole glycerol-phosphate synthase subunit HisH
MINILNIGDSNAVSIFNTLEDLDYPCNLVSSASNLKDGILILPGVGSIGNFKDHMRIGDWESTILKYHKAGNKLIGICLGFQAMTAFSQESGGKRCMNIFQKNIQTIYFEKNNMTSHTSWENFKIHKNFLDKNGWIPLYKKSRKKILSGRVFYNHQFAVNHKSTNSIQINDYDSFSGMIVKKNIIGMQFHPEKSQDFGKEIFKLIL